jgi:LysM repeat protein
MKQKYSMLRFLSCFLVTVLFPVLIQAQTKSTNIQTINGKKYYLHKMEKGQSLYSLTKLYGVDLNSIYAENPQAKTGTKAGEEIKIPFVNASSSVTTTTISTPTVLATSSVSAQSQPIDTNRYKTYKVAKGETLYSITKKINLSDKELEKWNPSISQGIKEGQLLIIGEKRKTGNSIATPVSVTTPTYNPDSINPHVIHAKKQSYNVGLFLPFRTDLSLATDINYLAQKKLNFPSMSSLAIDFYLGFKKAVDSATVKDMEVNLIKIPVRLKALLSRQSLNNWI